MHDFISFSQHTTKFITTFSQPSPPNSRHAATVAVSIVRMPESDIARQHA